MLLMDLFEEQLSHYGTNRKVIINNCQKTDENEFTEERAPNLRAP